MNRKNWFPSPLVTSLVACAAAASCTSSSVQTPEHAAPATDTALSTPITPAVARGLASLDMSYDAGNDDHDTEKTVYVDQNWTAAERELWYRTPQGSHIMPLKFALALEQSNSSERFMSSKNLSGYGFIPQVANAKTNPWGLPVGFTVDGAMKFNLLARRSVDNGERQLGVNCALCHTATFHYNGKALRIDGGQTLANFQTFVHDMDFALKTTREDKEKLSRFLDRVGQLDKTGNSNDKTKLLAQFDAAVADRGDWTNLNDANHNYGHGYNDSKFVHGPGRIDAFDAIFNQVLARDLRVPSNASEANNPVSPPVIWDAPQADVVQWNGLASNDIANGGPIARNIGEVLGVFGRVDFSRQTKELGGYCSTALRDNLETLEGWVRKLWSPLWPEDVLGTLDPAKVEQGRQLYVKYECAGCHQGIHRMDPERTIKSQLIPMSTVGTDPKFNNNAVGRIADSSILKGHLTRLKAGRPLEAKEPAATVLRHAVAGAIAGSISPITCAENIDIGGMDILQSWIHVFKIATIQKPAAQDDDVADKSLRTSALVKRLKVYKARPLNGIWASPPFLHNGSVNSLYDLLLKPEERKNFYLGCDTFDPVKVGLNCAADNGGFLYDTSIPGNQAIGHDYGPRGDNAEAERMALVEYMKSL